MKKKIGWGTAIALLIYMLLLAVLTAVESAQEASSIHSFADALWYSLVTITTVGYGDLYPVSTIGRWIGVFFLLLSVGFLAFIISAAYSMIMGRFRPGLLLRMKQNRPWFLFSRKNAAAAALAGSLAKEHPDALMIFCNASDEESDAKLSRGSIAMSEDIREVLQRYKSSKGERSVFLIAEDDLQNCDDALALAGEKAALYCQSEEIHDMADVAFFDPWNCCARLFWQEHPLDRKEDRVLLVGNGRYAQALLNQAMITNCQTPVRTVQYHLFGDWSQYLRAHHRLDQAMAIDREADGMDALFFHEGEWDADADLIAHADRIIFCTDDADENMRSARILERCHVHSGKVYVRTSRKKVPGCSFGAIENLYTPELVMKQQLDQLAMKMHEHYRRSAGYPVAAWSELDSFTRNSNRAAADHIPAKIRLLLDTDGVLQSGSCIQACQIWEQADDALREICRQNEHDRWVRFHSLYNWQYAPVRNNAARQHPSLLPYEQLSAQERAKDDYAWQLLAEYAEIQEQL